jgi:hypothetical protein
MKKTVNFSSANVPNGAILVTQEKRVITVEITMTGMKTVVFNLTPAMAREIEFAFELAAACAEVS